MINHNDILVSEHLQYHEVSCRCSGKFSTCPGLIMHRGILNMFEEFRMFCGSFPIHVSRGYSCPEHNATVPLSSSSSKHIIGAALDLLFIMSKSSIWFWEQAEEFMSDRYGGLGFYSWGVHIDCWKEGGKRRWYVKNGVYYQGYPEEIRSAT